jgi:hypothetical protein
MSTNKFHLQKILFHFNKRYIKKMYFKIKDKQITDVYFRTNNLFLWNTFNLFRGERVSLHVVNRSATIQQENIYQLLCMKYIWVYIITWVGTRSLFD